MVDITATPNTHIPTEAPSCECTLLPSAALLGPDDLRVHHDARPEAVRAVRRALRRWLGQVAVDDDTADAVLLLIDEAVTNAVEHAALERTCSVEVIAGARACGEGISVLVKDDGTWRPQPQDHGHRGRGVTLIGRLADRSTITVSPSGTTVRMCWATPRAA